MVEYITDLSIVTILVIGLTAFMGVITNGIGVKLLGGRNKMEFVDKSNEFQTGWRQVGGKKKK